MVLALFLALGANLSFSTASLFYTHYSIKYSPIWMNFFKAVVATIGFFTIVFGFKLYGPAQSDSYCMLALSGFFGLFIADIFLLKAMTRIGAGRTLMLFGFSPLILGLSAKYLFHQDFSSQKLIAIFCLIGCLWSFSFESFKQNGSWEIKGLAYALIGVLVDNVGVLLTRQSFELSPEMDPFQANLVRAVSAVIGFLIISRFSFFKFSPVTFWRTMNPKDKWIMFFVSFVGTCVSLGFYLTAIKVGHLATVSAVTVTSPLFATLLEVMTGRKKANCYLFIALTFFLVGFAILVGT